MYVIRGLINTGYWCEQTNSFRGYERASKYISDLEGQDLYIALEKAIEIQPCEVIKVFSNE